MKKRATARLINEVDRPECDNLVMQRNVAILTRLDRTGLRGDPTFPAPVFPANVLVVKLGNLGDPGTSDITEHISSFCQLAKRNAEE